ncbi:hypothetical protein [Micromonospora sp. NPDC049274]|uniref:hypothetical protein n=1 Tax=Micromonospora sp. NPDC049274 TaxID=3154829 RepID=UPI0034368C3E
MADGKFSARIENALAIEEPWNSARAVKEIVAAEFHTLDPRVEIKFTEYFNHTFAPDLVLRWPGASGSHERYVYLKYNSEIEFLLDDLRMVENNRPILLGLEAQNWRDPESAKELALASKESDTLVTDPAGVETLAEQSNNKFFRLVGSAFAQGGRGLVNERIARLATMSLQAGLQGARAVEQQPTAVAAMLVQELLRSEYAGRIVRLLQAIWVGSGGRLEEFPGDRSLDEYIPDDALQFLLEMEVIDDKFFWDRVGQRVTVAQLNRLKLPDGSPNLELLMLVSRHRLWARACRVRSEQPVLSDEVRDKPYWVIDRHLALKWPRFVAYLAATVDQLEDVPENRHDGLRFLELTQRASGMIISDLEWSSDGRILRYSSEDHEDVAHDPAVWEFERGLGAYALIRRAGITLPSRKQLYADFMTNTVGGKGGTKLVLSELLPPSLQLLRDLTNEENEQLVEQSSAPDYEADEQPPTLFDLD